MPRWRSSPRATSSRRWPWRWSWTRCGDDESGLGGGRGRDMSLTQVAIPKGDGFVTISLSDFLAMPLDQRLTLILEQRLKFYDDQGVPMSTTEGLRVLRQMRQVRTAAG